MSAALLDTGPLLEAMRKLQSEIGRINMQFPIKSPVRAGLKTLTDQMKEVGTVITGDPDYFHPKLGPMPPMREKSP